MLYYTVVGFNPAKPVKGVVQLKYTGDQLAKVIALPSTAMTMKSTQGPFVLLDPGGFHGHLSLLVEEMLGTASWGPVGGPSTTGELEPAAKIVRIPSGYDTRPMENPL